MLLGPTMPGLLPIALHPIKLHHLPGYLRVLFQRFAHDLARGRRKQKFSLSVLQPRHILPPPRRSFGRRAFEDADGLVGVDGIADLQSSCPRSAHHSAINRLRGPDSAPDVIARRPPLSP